MEDALKKAKELESRVRSSFDQPDHPQAEELERMVKRLVDEIEMKRPWRSVEDRVKDTRELVLMLEEGVMSSSDMSDIRSRCDRLRQDIIRLDKES